MKQFVVCIDNKDYQASLELFKVYVTSPDDKGNKHDFIRVLDESGEEYLYPKKMFAEVDLPKPVAQAVLQASSFSPTT